MIKSKKELIEVLNYEKKCYRQYMFPTLQRVIMGAIKHEPIAQIWKWQKASRYYDYYRYVKDSKGGFWSNILYTYYARKRNKLASKIGIEIETTNIGKGFMLLHTGATVINGATIMGDNCKLRGNNCIGVSHTGSDCPILGNNILMGAGSKIFGNIKVADGVEIAAGAVVVKDILEPGCIVGGVPAKVLKHSYPAKQIISKSTISK